MIISSLFSFFYFFLFSSLFNHILSIEVWEDKSTSYKEFDKGVSITGYITDSDVSGYFTTINNPSSNENYLYDFKNNRQSSNTNLTHISRAMKFPSKSMFFYCSDHSEYIYSSSTNDLKLTQYEPQFLDTEKKPPDYIIRCFEDPKSDPSQNQYVITVFLKSGIAKKYKINENKWEKFYDHKFKALAFVKLPYKNGDNSEFYLFLLESKDNKTQLGRLEFSFDNADYTFSGQHSFAQNLELYDTNEISYIASKTKNIEGKMYDYALIFTYTKGGNKFKYYYVYFEHVSEPKVLMYGDEFTLPFFQDCIFEDFHFIKRSELFYYRIKKGDEEYIGTGDLLYGILIYNIKKTANSISIDNYNYQSTTQYLVYANENTLYKVCPFVMINNQCEAFKEESTTLIKISSTEGNTQVTSCDLNAIGRYCIEQCPSGYESSSNKCVQCPNYYDAINHKCIDSCPAGSIGDEKTKVCYSCKSIGKFYWDYKCLDSCEEAFGVPDEDNICHSCKEKELWYQDNKCVNECSKGYGKNETVQSCTYCKKNNQFYLNGMCVKGCNEYQLYDNDNICYYCNETVNPYFEEGKCVSSCNKGSARDEEKQVCTFCKIHYQYLSDNKCVDKCEEVYDEYNQCYTCLSVHKYFEEGQCKDNCTEGYGKDEELHKCIHCIDNGTVYYEEQCLKKCPDILVPGGKDNICKTCHAHNETYYQEGECVDKCSERSVKNDTDFTCTICSIHGQHIQKNQCVDHCSEHSYLYEDFCLFCLSNGTRFENGTCVTECHKGFEEKTITEFDTNVPICQACNDSQLFIKDKCENTDKCPDWTIVVTEPYRGCYYCKDEFKETKPYYERGECKSGCSKGAILDSDNYACIVCKDKGDYKEGNRCVKKCADYSVVNYTINTCSTCNDLKKKYFIENENRCENTCPKGFQTKEDIGVCVNCTYHNQSILIDKCVDQCPEDTYIDEEHFCHSCFCSGKSGNCIKTDTSYKCKCEDNFFGYHCEIGHKENPEMNIYSLKDTVIYSEINEFGFRLIKQNGLRELSSDSLLGRTKDYIIKWSLEYKEGDTFNSLDDVLDGDFFMNGFNETTFKINAFKLQKNHLHKIKLNLTDLNDNKTYTDELTVNISTITNTLYLKISYGEEESYIPMKTLVYMSVEDHLTQRLEKLYYQFFYKDEYNEKIPITGKNTNNEFSTLLPFAKGIYAEVSNDWGEIISLEESLDVGKLTSYDVTIDVILRKEDTFDKYQGLNVYFYSDLKKNVTQEELDKVLSFVDKEMKEQVEYEANNKTIEYSNLRIYKPNQFISLLNRITLTLNNLTLNNQSMLMKDSSNIAKINQIVSNSVNIINALKTNYASKQTILSLYRNLDVIIELSDKYANKKDLIFNATRQTITNMKNILTRQMSSGEQLMIIGKNFKTFIDQPGKDQDTLFIDSPSQTIKDYTNFDDYNIINQIKGKSCNNSYFCIKENYYNNLYDDLTYLKNQTLTKVSFSIIEINSIEPYVNATGVSIPKSSKSSAFIDIFSPETNSSIGDKIESFFYEIKIPMASDELMSSSFDSEIKNDNKSQNKVCVPINHLNDDRYYCYTYFNYTSKEIICKCNVAGEIVGLLDQTLAAFYKSLQFESITLKAINYFNSSIVLSSLGLIGIFSFLLLIYDLFDDQKIARLNQMPRNQRVKHEYEQLKHLENASIFKFAWYLTYYKFPFLNVFSFYNYDHPRYFRFFIHIVCLLLSLFFSALPYYKTSFNKRDVFVNERNIEDADIDFHSFSVEISEVLSGFVYSLIASLIVNLISIVFSKLMHFQEVRKKIWKPRKDYLLGYVYDEIKSDVLLGEKWMSIKTRIMAFNKICAWKLLAKINRNDKFNKYLAYKKGCSENKELKNFVHIELEKIRSRSSSIIQTDAIAPLLPPEEHNNEISIYKGNDLEKDANELIQVAKPIQSFTLNNNSQNLLPIKTIHKFEQIKIKYINSSNANEKNEEDNESEDEKEINKDMHLEITPLDNYTYISTNIVAKADKTKGELRQICCNLSLNIILFALLIGIYYLLIMIFYDIYNTYEGYIIKAWLIPALFQVTLFRFALNFILNLCISLVLFKYTYKKNISCVVKIFFKLFIEKYMIYLNKIRLLITKYSKDFEYIQIN